MAEKLKLLNYVRPAMAVLPEVEESPRKVLFKYRALWTMIATLIYLICS
jgi:protein transport protein SEC61 subunit alpha